MYIAFDKIMKKFLLGKSKIFSSKLTLKFLDPKDEEEFLIWKQQYQIICMRCFHLLIVLFLVIGPFSTIPIVPHMRTELTVIAVLAIFLIVVNELILRYYIKKIINYFETLFFFTIFFSNIMFTETFLIRTESKSFQFNSYYISGGISQCIILFILVSRIKWKYVLYSLPIVMIFIPIRIYFRVETAGESSWFLPIANTLILFTLSFLQERTERLHFIERKEHMARLESFKNLINNIIPSQVIITRRTDQKVIFLNKAAQDFFNPLKHKEEIMEKVAALRVEMRPNNKGELSILDDNSEIKFSKLYENFDDISDEVEHMSSSQMVGHKKKRFHQFNASFSDKHLFEINNNTNTIPFMDDDVLDAGKVYFDLKIGEIEWDNETAVLILLNDISDTKKINHMRAIDAYKDNLLATVSHNLRTPLNGIIGMTELLKERYDRRDYNRDKEEKTCIKVAIRSAKLLYFMVNDILDYSQISAGNLKLSVLKANIDESVQEVINLIKFQAKRKNIQFLYTNKCRYKEIITDVLRLKQIILILLTNSLKFTNTGSIELCLASKDTGNKEKETANLEISVKDTGIGIKEEDIPKLFKLFGTLEQKNSNLYEHGIGLGLVLGQSLAKHLNNSIDGGIHLKTQFGKGSTFSFSVPGLVTDIENYYCEINSCEKRMPTSFRKNNDHVRLQEPLQNNNTQESSRRNPQPNLLHDNQILETPPRKKCALIVDDDQINLLVVSKYLESFNMSFETAVNGKIAVDLIEARAKTSTFFDVILMDCDMPVMNGFEATRRIVEMIKSKVIRDVPIIAVTANISTADFEFCRKAGMDFYMAKPLHKQPFKEKLENVFVEFRPRIF